MAREALLCPYEEAAGIELNTLSSKEYVGFLSSQGTSKGKSSRAGHSILRDKHGDEIEYVWGGGGRGGEGRGGCDVIVVGLVTC